MNARITLIYLLFLCSFLAGSCTSSPTPSTSLPAITTKPSSMFTMMPEINSSQVTMPTLTRTLKPIQSGTKTPESTYTQSSTRMITPSSMVTLTSLATLSPTEAQDLILNLLTNNAGCRLPCWWGFTPGITRWEVAQVFLETFTKIIDHTISPTAKIYSPEVLISVPEDVYPQPLRHVYVIDMGDDKVINLIWVETGNMPAYRLPTILSEYGQPDEVWLLSSAGGAGSIDVPFVVVLFYGSQGFAVDYNIDVHLRMPIIGCPQQAKYPWLWVWSANAGKTYSDLARETYYFGYGGGSPSFMPLEQATGISVETFYNTFKNEENTTCLETPLELWLAEGQTVISTTVSTTTP
jgi:hypothetical protein